MYVFCWVVIHSSSELPSAYHACLLVLVVVVVTVAVVFFGSFCRQKLSWSVSWSSNTLWAAPAPSFYSSFHTAFPKIPVILRTVISVLSIPASFPIFFGALIFVPLAFYTKVYNLGTTFCVKPCQSVSALPLVHPWYWRWHVIGEVENAWSTCSAHALKLLRLENKPADTDGSLDSDLVGVLDLGMCILSKEGWCQRSRDTLEFLFGVTVSHLNSTFISFS